MNIYIVTMYRYGDRESHSYVLGCWSTKDLAIANGNTEILWRGNKYYFEVVEYVLDTPNDIDNMPRIVYSLEESRGRSDDFHGLDKE